MKTKLVFLVALLVSATFALAQESSAPQVGYSCTYKDTGGKTFRQTVSSVNADGTFVVKAGNTERAMSPEWILTSRGGVPNKNSDLWKGRWYPFSEDKVAGFEARFSYANAQGGTTEARERITSVRREKVTVPAGTFDAIIVTVRMDYTNLSNSYSNYVETITTYPAENKGLVLRYSRQDWGIDSRPNGFEAIACGGLNQRTAKVD